MPSHPFSFTTPLKFTMQLEWLTSISSPNSLTRLLLAITVPHRKPNPDQTIKKRLMDTSQ